MTTIAFIGLGNMGGPMAANLVKAGHRVIGVDPAEAAQARLQQAGGEVAASAVAAAAEAEMAITMLPNGALVRQVLLEDEGGMLAALPEGALAIDSSTIDVETARAVAEAAGGIGRMVVDAPVSGGVGGAEAATLTFMVGGSEPAFQAARPVLEAMGRNIFHAGEAGAGQAAKACNNMMLAIQMISVCEGFRLAESLGLAPERLFEIAATSSGRCWSLDTYAPVPGLVPAAPSNRDYQGGFTTNLMLKDLGLALEAANNHGAMVPLAAQAASLYQIWAHLGHGGEDFSSIFKMLGGDA